MILPTWFYLMYRDNSDFFIKFNPTICRFFLSQLSGFLSCDISWFVQILDKLTFLVILQNIPNQNN